MDNDSDPDRMRCYFINESRSVVGTSPVCTKGGYIFLVLSLPSILQRTSMLTIGMRPSHRHQHYPDPRRAAELHALSIFFLPKSLRWLSRILPHPVVDFQQTDHWVPGARCASSTVLCDRSPLLIVYAAWFCRCIRQK